MDVKLVMYIYVGCVLICFGLPLLIMDIGSGIIAIEHLHDKCNTKETPVSLWLLITSIFVFICLGLQSFYMVMYAYTGKRKWHILQVVGLILSEIVTFILSSWGISILYEVYSGSCFSINEFVVILIHAWIIFFSIDFLICVPLGIIFTLTMSELKITEQNRPLDDAIWN